MEPSRDQVTFEPAAGITVKLNGKPMGAPTMLRSGSPPNSRDRVEFGDFEFAIPAGDGIYQLLVRDRQSPYLKQFWGALWFPVSASYRVAAVFVPYDQSKELKVPDTAGRSRSMRARGNVTFRLNGETFRLDPVVSGNELFFMFKDRTSGRETYGARRFLEAEMPKNGKVVLDFNKAHNPYCAFNPYSSCPIPPKQNTLDARIEAGQKYRGEH